MQYSLNPLYAHGVIWPECLYHVFSRVLRVPLPYLTYEESRGSPATVVVGPHDPL